MLMLLLRLLHCPMLMLQHLACLSVCLSDVARLPEVI
jgi:hypothetical protein